MQRAWLITACVIGSTLSCAKSATVAQCAPERWEGECQLASVTKVEDSEFPVPHVVMEAVYHPIANASHPGYTPGAIAERTMVRAPHELALYDHLEAHPRVACRTEAPQNGACVSPRVAISLPAFNPSAAPVSAAPAVTGCAQIEATSTQDRLRGGQQTQTFVSQRLAFAENSAELPPDAELVTAEIAKMLSDKPSIECLGIVGQIAAGEAPGLAEQRAKAVRDLLSAHGVSPTRLLTVGATARVFGSGAKPAEPDPADRRVGFSVLLESAPPP